MFPLTILLLGLLQAAPAGTDAGNPSESTQDAPTSTQAPAAPRGTPHVPGLRPEDPTRPPLLPEGTYLMRVRGTIDYDDGIGSWVFKTEDVPKSRFKHVFGLLPSTSLEDALGVLEKHGATASFECTGRTLIYDGNNFLLPSVTTHVAPLTIRDELDPPARADDEAVDSASPANTLDDGADVGDRLEDRLRERIGSLPRSADTGSPDTSERVQVMREGVRIQNRRGAIVRDQRTGTWRFVFDAVGSDALDPTMELLPCLLLERLQRQAAISDLPPAVLMSGEVTSFHGRNYLLPTIWRAGRPSRNITP